MTNFSTVTQKLLKPPGDGGGIAPRQAADYDGGMASRYFALVPAAGHSTRMGQPKLLLPLGGRPLIAHTLGAWGRSPVDRIVIVVRPGDEELAMAIREIATPPDSGAIAGSKLGSGERPIDLVIPRLAPPDMKASVQAALREIEKYYSPTSEDAFLVAPADMPRLSPAIVGRLIEVHRLASKQTILVPTISGSRGHPVLFPWPVSADVFRLAAEEGLNAIVDSRPVQLVSCDGLVENTGAAFDDIDTPEQFRQLTTGN